MVTNNTKTYKWVIGMLVALLISMTSFVVGGQILTPTVRETVRRVDKNEIHIEQVMSGVAEIKLIINKQNDKLDRIYRELARNTDNR